MGSHRAVVTRGLNRTLARVMERLQRRARHNRTFRAYAMAGDLDQLALAVFGATPQPVGDWRGENHD